MIARATPKEEESREDAEPKSRTTEILARLEAKYGVPKWFPRMDPLDELISCVLSQHTSDANSFRAFDRMKERFPTWEAVIDAPPDELADSIRIGRLADS